MDRFYGCRGFSLLEILVAFAIMSLTLTVVFQVFSSGLRTTMVAEEYGRAVRLADNLLMEHATIRPLRPGEYTGRVEGQPYHWQVIIDQGWEVRDGMSSWRESLDVYDIRVRVYWQAGAGEREVLLQTLRLQAGG